MSRIRRLPSRCRLHIPPPPYAQRRRSVMNSDSDGIISSRCTAIRDTSMTYRMKIACLAGVALAALPAWSDPAQSTPKVIYGPDDRLDVYQVSDPTLLSYAA